jgi:hypothetical protein
MGVVDRLLALAGECREDGSIACFGGGGFETKLDGLRAKAPDSVLFQICGGIPIFGVLVPTNAAHRRLADTRCTLEEMKKVLLFVADTDLRFEETVDSGSPGLLQCSWRDQGESTTKQKKRKHTEGRLGIHLRLLIAIVNVVAVAIVVDNENVHGFGNRQSADVGSGSFVEMSNYIRGLRLRVIGTRSRLLGRLESRRSRVGRL